MSKKCKYYSTIHTSQSHTMSICNYYNEDLDICYCYGDVDRCEMGVGEYAGVLEKLQPIYDRYKNSPDVIMPIELVEEIIEELKGDDKRRDDS